MLDIREGLRANIEAGVTDFQVSAYMLANPTPPTIHLFPEEVMYDEAMRRGLDEIRITVQAFVGLVSDQGAQVRLDELLAPAGAGSLKAAVEADPTLGGTVDDLRVVGATGYKVYSVGGQVSTVLGCEWTVHVIAIGT